MNTTTPTPTPRLAEHADALAKAALQATCRAMHVAQLAAEAYKRTPDTDAQRETFARRGAICAVLRDALTDAYAAVPDPDRAAIRHCRANMDSDQLLDLLALIVRG